MTEDQNTDRLTAEDSEYQLGQLPCKCGGMPRVKSLRGARFEYHYYVGCDVCKRVSRAYSTIEDAIKKWNSYVSNTNPTTKRQCNMGSGQ